MAKNREVPGDSGNRFQSGKRPRIGRFQETVEIVSNQENNVQNRIAGKGKKMQSGGADVIHKNTTYTNTPTQEGEDELQVHSMQYCASKNNRRVGSTGT